MRKHVVLFLAVLFPFCGSVAADEGGGEAIYKARCAACHGKDGVPKGFAETSPAFNDEAWKKANSTEAIEKVVAEGRKKMPAFKNKLRPEQIRAVAAYLKTL